MNRLALDRLRKSPFRLLVEGPDDQHTITNLLKQHGVNYDALPEGAPYVESCDGWTRVLEAMPVAVKTYNRLGVVLDRDFPPENRWHSVRDLLRKQAIAVPDDLPLEGLVVAGTRPNSTVGVWLMPDNQSEGMLEHFLDRLIPQDALWDHALDATQEARTKAAPFRHEIKARVHTWLAWQEPPGQPFGVAITARCFQAAAPEALLFVDWFRRTFPES